MEATGAVDDRTLRDARSLKEVVLERCSWTAKHREAPAYKSNVKPRQDNQQQGRKEETMVGPVGLEPTTKGL